MKTNEIIIEHPSQLNSLKMIPFMRTKGLGKILLGGELLEHPQKKDWEKNLNKYYYACGCDTGAKVLLIGLLLGIAWSIYNYTQGKYSILKCALIIVISAIVGAVIGKLYGLLKARRKLNNTIKDIQSIWDIEPGEEDEI